MCENILFLRLLKYFNTALSLMRFIVPILLIIKLTIDIYKGIIEVGDNSAKEKILKRVIACVIIFLVPTMVNVFLELIETISGYNFSYSECTYNIKNIDFLVEKEELEAKLILEQESSVNYQKYQAAISDLNSKIANNTSSTTDAMGIRIGEKYNVTDKQLENIAKVCQREQGRPTGAAAEAELMINKYVMSGYSGSFYDYLFNSKYGKWWHPIKVGNYSSTKLKPEIKEAVRKVVVEGQRKYPAYINEHDCIKCGDVKYITTNGNKADKNNRNEYVQDKTFVYTVYKASSSVKYWIFYAFPDEKSDPFGYTHDAKEKLASISR